MERIQSAIAKARAARHGSPEAPAAGEAAAPGAQSGTLPGVLPGVLAAARPPSARPDLAAAHARDAAWEELAEVTVSHRTLDANRIVAHSPGAAASVFDVMRTNLLRQMRANGWTRVAITSPGSACGKTTTCLNLAFSLGRQNDLRTMVIELDLRRPSMARLMGRKAPPRFADVLAGRAAPQTHLFRVGPNLAFGINPGMTPDSAELLASTQAAAEIDAIEARWRPDVMLFDLPPALVTDDTLAFLDQVDCVLMVAGAEQSTVGEIDRCGQELAAHTKVLGVILNKCRYMDHNEGYGHAGEY
jgi:protein-tyrosine kinase